MSFYHKNLNKVLAGWKEITGEPGIEICSRSTSAFLGHYGLQYAFDIFDLDINL